MESSTRYDNSTKDHWRRWVWNQMRLRLPKGSPVLVFCGESGLDFDVAKEKGLIAIGIDRNMNCVSNFRRKGGIAICDRFKTSIIYLQRWVDGVILDELGGICQATVDNCFLSMCCKVVAVNYLRGRDTLGSQLWTNNNTTIDHLFDYTSGRPRKTEVGKHRAKLMYLSVNLFVMSEQIGKQIGICVNEYDLLDVLPKLCKLQRPVFSSYKSMDSGQRFDSGVWSTRLHPTHRLMWVETRENKASKRKAAAAKALFTMRTKL